LNTIWIGLALTNSEMSRIKALGLNAHHVQMDMFSHIIGLGI